MESRSGPLNGSASPYVGRFAPSPTGQLHAGTLAVAAASFLHARQQGGEWLVRIEDIDPPREVPGSADAILRALERLGLHWDREVEWQRERCDAHLAAAQELYRRGLAYYCRCSRQQIRSESGSSRYPGTCRDLRLPPDDAALRLRLGEDSPDEVRDELGGPIQRDIAAEDGDFVIVRRDGWPAYHLAVVVDDAANGITDIVRGADLLESTPLHVRLQGCLALPTPRYWHIPLITNAAGEKLSKRAGAAAVDTRLPSAAVTGTLGLLGLEPPAALQAAQPRELWAWAQAHWNIRKLGDSRVPIVLADERSAAEDLP